MARTGAPSVEVLSGRFAGRLYAVATVATPIWAILTGATFDGRLISFVVACAAAAGVPHLPIWNDHGRLFVRLTLVVASLVQVTYMTMWFDNPIMMGFPAISAAYAGVVLDRRWIIGHLLPPAVVLFTFVADRSGTSAALGQAILFLSLWIALGEIPLWLRGLLDTANRSIVDSETEAAERAREELANRSALAASLRQLVEEVTDASHSVEGQSTSIATAIGQLAGSATRIAETAGVAERAVHQIAAATDESQELIGRLDRASDEIVGIVATIAGLAQQTNLLALNATIESARAGDAGRGFAVVANEVKDLAQRTATSAAGITTVVDQVRSSLTASSTAMSAIAEMVDGLETDQSTLSNSVMEQTQVIETVSLASSDEARGVAEIVAAMRRLGDNARLLDQGSGGARLVPGR